MDYPVTNRDDTIGQPCTSDYVDYGRHGGAVTGIVAERPNRGRVPVDMAA